MQSGINIGQNNKELVDHLMRLGHIRSKEVERVFRVVDRATYILKSHKDSAYKDVAWKNGNIHLSAPCIYSEVLETLALESGLSFLNLGSGTGYLSTMAGLLLSSCGINHGVELHEDCLKYAYEKLEEFKQKSVAVDEFDFCEPVFIQGNCLNLMPDRQYDRVYCGAACPEYYEGFIKQFVRIGGILVMPTKDHLLRLQKLNNDTWSIQYLLPVSFATLVIPSDEEHNIVRLPEYVPRPLQEICRDGIRRCIRNNILHEHANLISTEVVIQSGFLEHHALNSPKSFGRELDIPTFDVDSDNISSADDLESFQLLTAFFQSHTDYGVDLCSCSELKFNNYSHNHLESCLKNDIFNPSVERNHSLSINDSIVICGTHLAGKNQQLVNNTNNQVLNKNEVQKQNIDINIKPQTQNDVKTSYSFMGINNQDRAKERNIMQQESSLSQNIQFVEEKDNFYSKNHNVLNESGQTQSNSETITNLCADDFYSTNLAQALIQPTRFNNSKDNINATVKSTNHADNNAFTLYMTEQIWKLPLPYSLKTYINYNRQL